MPDDDTAPDTAVETSTSVDTSTAGAPSDATATDSGSASADTLSQATDAPSQLHTGAHSGQDAPQGADWTKHVPPELQAVLSDPRRVQHLMGLNKQYGTLSNEVGQLRDKLKAFGDADPQQVQRLLTEAQQRQTAPAFSKRHPDYAATRERITKADLVAKTADALGLDPSVPEDRAKLAKLVRTHGLKPEDMELRDQAIQHRERMLEEFHADPDEFIAGRVESLVSQQIQQYEQFTQARASTSQWMSDPTNAAYLKQYANELNAVVDPQVSLRDKVGLMGAVLAERDALKRRLGEQVEQVATAGAQSAALNARAAGVGRRSAPSGQRVTDAAVYVQQVLKTPFGHPDYIQKLTETNAKIQAGEL